MFYVFEITLSSEQPERIGALIFTLQRRGLRSRKSKKLVHVHGAIKSWGQASDQDRLQGKLRLLIAKLHFLQWLAMWAPQWEPIEERGKAESPNCNSQKTSRSQTAHRNSLVTERAMAEVSWIKSTEKMGETWSRAVSKQPWGSPRVELLLKVYPVQYLEPIYAKNIFIVYLKCRFNWIPSVCLI